MTSGTTFTVHLDVRSGGPGLYAKSKDVPGLHIAGTTPESLRDTAMRAVKDLYKRNRNVDVEVSPTDDLTELRVRVA